jgi:hypothetical protein
MKIAVLIIAGIVVGVFVFGYITKYLLLWQRKLYLNKKRLYFYEMDYSLRVFVLIPPVNIIFSAISILLIIIFGSWRLIELGLKKTFRDVHGKPIELNRVISDWWDGFLDHDKHRKEWL